MATFTIKDNRTGRSAEFEVLDSTLGSPVVDITGLHKELGVYTYDNGLGMTATCQSEITFIDGAKGELLYRGYPIEELAEKKNYIEVCYLILHGELPNSDQYESFEKDIRIKSYPHEGIKNLFSAFPDNGHPMAILSSAVSALSAFHHQHLNIKDDEEFMEMARRIIAKMPTLAAYTYRHSMGYPLIYPDMDRYFTENFLYMLRAFPTGKTEISEVETRALDTIFMLHADHEQNASTTTVRAVGSTGAHPYAAVVAGINALWGRAHGGANESVIAQLEMIGSVENVDRFIKRAKDPNDPFRLMGFGHRVYKNFDPRARVLKRLRDELRDTIGINSKLIEIADRVEEIALNDEYFVKRNLYPNIDFYSGTILEALGIRKKMFTPIFVIGRTVGWITHLIEQKRDPKQKIYRPRQRYIGKKRRSVP
ncbi:citrate synthase [Nitrosophilus alvini]|uniref:citrate synthase n=1 Tax=Nitrosophilus alvini TaxID=2714855 RepID=UPI00190B51F8|nr:citrate synthase [Nitrosophilus alvini]